MLMNCGKCINNPKTQTAINIKTQDGKHQKPNRAVETLDPKAKQGQIQNRKSQRSKHKKW